MFTRKYKVSILDSKWHVIKNNIKLSVIPRQGEFIFMDKQYVKVLNVVHMLDEKYGVFIVTEQFSSQPENILPTDNQQVK